jgi:hypothetical protein
MKSLVLLLACSLLLTACDQTAQALQPIPGSITYGGQPRMKLTKSPIGSQVRHHFIDNFGQDVYETYIIQPDRSLKLVNREVMTKPF